LFRFPGGRDTGKAAIPAQKPGSVLFILSGMNAFQLDEAPGAEKNVPASFLLVASGSIFIQNVAAP
jgi:hypothetical protein